MYICDLIDKHGYSLIYKKGDYIGSYFGADTQNRNIILYNVRVDDIKVIESLLFSADNQYKGLYDL